MVVYGCFILCFDVFVYVIKKLDINDFFVELEIWDLLDEVKVEVVKYDMELLLEIYEYYFI